MSKFKVGDKVVVVKRVLTQAHWNNDWYGLGMDPYINNEKTYTIAHIDVTGVYFKEDGESYGFPTDSLCLVEEYIPPTKESLLVEKINKLYKRCPTTTNWSIKNV